MNRFCFILACFFLCISLSACQSVEGSAVPPEAGPKPQPAAIQTTAATEPTTEPATEAPTEPVLSYVEVFREGEASQIPVQIIHGTVGDYTVAMDPEYFTFCPQETVDLFWYESWEGSQAVAYSVSKYTDSTDPQAFIDSVVAQFGSQYHSYSVEQTAIASFDATAVYFNDYKEDPAYQMHVFLINCHGEYYRIEATFVFEMYEGLYAIMRALFDTFTPVSSGP